jgi:magnesium-transporting ATPase (P-type)
MDSIFLDAEGQQRAYKILKVIEFTSDRARMSVVIQLSDDVVRVLVKGSDTKME